MKENLFTQFIPLIKDGKMNTALDSSARNLKDESFSSTFRRLDEGSTARYDRAASPTEDLAKADDEHAANDLSHIIILDSSTRLNAGALPHPTFEAGDMFANLSFSDNLPDLIPQLL